MSKKAIQKYLLYGELVCVLLMSCFFAYRILTFSNSEPMGYLLARLICFVFALLIILQNIKSKVTIWGPTFLAVSYVLIVTFNILIVTKTSINDFTDAALWPLLFLTAYEVTAQNCISEVHLFRILKITKIVCLGYSFVLVIEHILGIIPGTSEMFPTYVLLALVPFSLYEMDMEHGIKFNVIYLICTFLIMLMTSKRSCILVLAVGIMGYFLVKAKVQGRNVKAIVNRMAKYILTILVIFLAMYFVTKLMKLDIVERLNEMLNGDTNGRSAIWENVLEAFNASTLSEKLIGHGYHAFRFYKYSGYMYILNGNLFYKIGVELGKLSSLIEKYTANLLGKDFTEEEFNEALRIEYAIIISKAQKLKSVKATQSFISGYKSMMEDAFKPKEDVAQTMLAWWEDGVLRQSREAINKLRKEHDKLLKDFTKEKLEQQETFFDLDTELTGKNNDSNKELLLRMYNLVHKEN